MFIFGESSVKGFATMLMITIIVTMFTMVFLTRILLGLFVKSGFFNDKTNAFIRVKKEDIPDIKKGEAVKVIPFKNTNFLKMTKKFVCLSILIILAGTGLIFGRGLNLGVDFKSGSDITIDTNKTITKKEIKNDLKELNIKSNEINITDGEVCVNTSETLKNKKVSEVSDYFEEKYDAKVNIGVISNVVKRELIKNAILSVLVALLGIILYVSFRFRFSYAVGGVVALLHDVLIMFAIFSIFHIEVNIMFIAAILSIIGYSINDTIVCFDRIRENLKHINMKKTSKEELISICNKSIQETFTRTIYTSVTTLLPVFALIFLGSREIFTFNLAMLIGLISGTYSSIFIATATFILLEKRNIGKDIKKKKVYKDDVNELNVKGVNC